MALKGAKKATSEGESPVVPGDILLGKYRVERKLGQGGMGIVVAAQHLELDELFAIKYLVTGAENEPNAIKRFLREARSSARLKSEHAAKVHDVGRLDSGMPYMIMEYLVGQDLKAYLGTHGKLSVEEAVGFVLQACDAVAEAHSLGIIHRDIKPSNLFLTKRRDGTPCVKVLDFGIAKEISAKDAELTKSGATLGSPLYMSPEQMAGSKSLDTRTDIWSLGVVLYELLTGTVPFYAETITELVAQVLQTVPKPPSHIRPELPPWIDDIVVHCLEKHPENRFLTIDDFVMALRTAEKAGTEAARVTATVRYADREDLPDVAQKKDPAHPIDTSGALPFAETEASMSTKDVDTMDSSTRGGIPVQVLRDEKKATNTQANPIWDTTTRAPQRPPRNRIKLGVIVGAMLAIVVLAVGSISLSRAPGDGQNATATNSAMPPSAMESTISAPLAPMPSFAPSAAFESARPPEAVSGAPQSDSTALPRTRTQKPQPVASAATRIEKKETEAGPQATTTARQMPPVPTAAPAPSSKPAPKTGYEGVL